MKIVTKGKLIAIYEDEQDWWNGTAVKEMQKYVNVYPKEQVLYFEEVPIVTITKEQIEGEQVAARLAKKNSVVQQLDEYYDLRDPFMLKSLPTGKNVSSGFLKLLNIFGNIRLYPNNFILVAIEKIENNLHPSLRAIFIEHLTAIKKVKRIVFTTQNESLFNYVDKNNF